MWFSHPATDYVATQIEDDLVVMKDSTGRVLGFEKHFFTAAPGDVHVQLETLSLMHLEDVRRDALG